MIDFSMGVGWMIGMRFLTARQKSHISFITIMAIVGVTIGVSALLIITGISSGFLEAFKEKVLGVNAHVIVLKVGETFHEYRDVTKTASREEGVSAAAPFIITEMMIAKGKSISGILIKGINPEDAAKILDLPKNIVKGSLDSLAYAPLPGSSNGKPSAGDDVDILDILDDESAAHAGAEEKNAAVQPPAQGNGEKEEAAEEDPGTTAILDEESGDGETPPGKKENGEGEKGPAAADRLPGMIIGQTLAENLGAKIGDTVLVISPLTGLDTSFTDGRFDTSISAEFKVTGIFYCGFDEYDSRLVFVNLYHAQRLFNFGDSVTGIEMKVDDIDRAKEIAASLDRHLTGGLYRIIDWEELNHPLFTALLVQKIALTVVLMLSVLMASLNIISMLILFIMNKKRDISILKSMGATRRQITSIFMIVGCATGIIGLILGSGLGVGICKILTAYGWPLDPKVYLIDHLPLKLSLSDYIICVTATMLICIIFTVIPSMKAASLEPVEGIKYE
jgi:lipoprotein-releasing system permease protein